MLGTIHCFHVLCVPLSAWSFWPFLKQTTSILVQKTRERMCFPLMNKMPWREFWILLLCSQSRHLLVQMIPHCNSWGQKLFRSIRVRDIYLISHTFTYHAQRKPLVNIVSMFPPAGFMKLNDAKTFRCTRIEKILFTMRVSRYTFTLTLIHICGVHADLEKLYQVALWPFSEPQNQRST